MNLIENIKYGEFDEQRIHLYLPKEKEFDVLIFLHGGGLENGDGKAEPFFCDLVEKGVAIVSGDYRKYPAAKYPEFIEDGASVVAWAKNNMHSYGKAKNFYICGSSAGAYIAMMLCFDEKYLQKHSLSNRDIAGYYFSAGQPTAHFNILNERGIDTRRIVVDETAPLYHVKAGLHLPPLVIATSDNDMENRYEQLMLLQSTIKHFGYDMDKVHFRLNKNSGHCEYESFTDESGNSLFAQELFNFMTQCKKI